ncbi:DMT family transporter [Nostoc sp. TCL26-01]|uniref:DMT family transporter n=1 Tax=Nostoc sp. TCL26-01 TaxID=2576904 RepID=UPI0015B89B3C|nr:DMT family transporter [Nostoc sp. TCL26-01]QLE56178.1 DMT family transporter [Nostoc sp. TCL26-01]
MNQIHKTSGQTYLWLAVIIFGASSAVTRKLTEIGAQHLVDGRNPISLCNVLFVGNLWALVVLILIYRRQWNQAILKQLSKKEWVSLIVVAILAGALAPGLIFQALAITRVNNVILVGRIEPLLTLALSIWLLKERVNFWELMGATIAFIGVTLTILLQPAAAAVMNMGSLHIGLGETLAVAGSVCATAAVIISKKYLVHTPLGIYSIVRTAIGTVVFFVSALVLYGQDHFADAFSPFLWQWMLVYSIVIVVIGQLLWLQGLRNSTTSTASLIGSFSPIVGVVAAYLILKEAPTTAQYIGGSLILVGIFLSQVGIQYQNARRTASSSIDSMKTEQALEAGMGFKGI